MLESELTRAELASASRTVRYRSLCCCGKGLRGGGDEVGECGNGATPWSFGGGDDESSCRALLLEGIASLAGFRGEHDGMVSTLRKLCSVSMRVRAILGP
jgi:hypothetical protein